MDDRELRHLLHEWNAPDAPADLRPRRTRRSRLSWLATGSIRVPVPAALAALLLAVLWISVPQSPSPPAGSAPSAGPGPGPRGEVARHALTGPLEGFDAVLVELTLPPGSAPEHRHPGFVLGYVAEGQMQFAVDHETARVLPTGATFFEPAGAIHTTFGSAGLEAPARVLAFMVVPAGSPLTGPT